MPSMRFVVHGADEVRRAMDISPRQARFAAARALSDTVADIRDGAVVDLPNEFTIRSGWVAKGIRIVRANTSTLVAEVGSVDDFMERQATGGDRDRPGVVPVGARPRPGAPTRPSMWPSRLKNGFIAPLSTGGLHMGTQLTRGGKSKVRRTTSVHAPNGKARPGDRGRSTFATTGIWQRYGPKVVATRGRYKGQKRQAIRLMYVLPDRVEIDNPRFRLREIAERVTKKVFVSHFQRRFADALASAR